MSRYLAQTIEALGLAQHAHADTELTMPGSSDTGWLEWAPSAPFQAVIAYWETFGDILSGVFQLASRHRGYSLGTKTIGPDEITHGSAFWLYVTDQDPVEYKITNLDTVPRTLYATSWFLNVMTLKQLDIIKVVIWEMMAPGMLRIAAKYGWIPEFPSLPPGMLTDVIEMHLDAPTLVSYLRETMPTGAAFPAGMR